MLPQAVKNSVLARQQLSHARRELGPNMECDIQNVCKYVKMVGAATNFAVETCQEEKALIFSV